MGQRSVGRQYFSHSHHSLIDEEKTHAMDATSGGCRCAVRGDGVFSLPAHAATSCTPDRGPDVNFEGFRGPEQPLMSEA